MQNGRIVAVDDYNSRTSGATVVDAGPLVVMPGIVDTHVHLTSTGLSLANDDVVEVLSARIVCGAANNQLAHPGIEKKLAERDILYTPDYCVNAGGLIQVADELEGFSFDRAKQRAAGIFETTRQVIDLAREDGVPPAIAADRLAERRIHEVGRLRGIWLRS